MRTHCFLFTFNIICMNKSDLSTIEHINSVKDAVSIRFQNICAERNLNANGLANLSGLTPSTVYSLFDNKRRDVSIITIKRLLDGLEMTLSDFFSSPEFDDLEQEIK